MLLQCWPYTQSVLLCAYDGIARALTLPAKLTQNSGQKQTRYAFLDLLLFMFLLLFPLSTISVSHKQRT
jgi:hypothetical protein